MANYASLKNNIDQYITTNGQGDITGAILNNVLKSIVDSIGADFLFGGIVEPSSNVGSPDQNVFYVAIKGGTYTNFGNVVIPDGITIFKWNGSWSNQILFAGDGGVFDITAYNNNTKYADLTAALGTNGANIPEYLRKGGMSVKFVQTSNDKYVLARCMAQSFTTDVTQWQGVDNKPTAGSENFVKSGGILNNLLETIDENIGFYKQMAAVHTISNNYYTIDIPIPTIKAGTTVRLTTKGNAVITTFRVDGNAMQQNRSNITNVNDSVDYTPQVDITKLVLFISNCTVAGNVTIQIDTENSISKEIKDIKDNTEDVENNVEYNAKRIENMPDCYGESIKLTLEEGKWIQYSDGITIGNNASYNCTLEYLAVKEGEKYGFLSDSGALVGCVCCYDEQKNYLKDMSIAGAGGYMAILFTVPKGVSFLRFTLTATNQTPFISKIYQSRIAQRDSINTEICKAESVNLTSGEPYLLPTSNYHKTNWIIQANFRSLSGYNVIRVGKGFYQTLSYGGMWIEVDNTNVYIQHSGGTYLTQAHGLTISDYLDVRLENFCDKTDESPSYVGAGDATFIKLTLFDGISEFTIDKTFFLGGDSPFVYVQGTNNAVVNVYYWCTDLKNELWCYGDSYFSIAQTRWPYWILTRGYTALFNGKPGANSQYMWERLCYDLQCGNPRKVFWCLGMNDGDNGAINTSWKNFLQKVLDICGMRGIEVILATIPNTPTIDNTYKNNYIRGLNYQYVDFASAVLNASGTGWINGMMEDNVHPNKKGARCLANAAMKLFISKKNI